jgi:hypothetical protein
LVCSTKMCH